MIPSADDRAPGDRLRRAGSRLRRVNPLGLLAHPTAVRMTADIAFEIADDLSENPVVTMRLSTAAGPPIFMPEPVVQGTTLLLNGMHVQDATAPPGSELPTRLSSLHGQ